MYAICHIKNYYCKCTNTKYKKFYLLTGISVRCRPDAMNESSEKLTPIYMVCITGLYKEIRVQMLRICANYFVGMIKSSIYGH